MAFYRLVGTVYFYANRACLNKYDTPQELMNTCSSPVLLEKHHQFLHEVREASGFGIFEDQLLPSDEALRLHWLRYVRVGQVRFGTNVLNGILITL